MLDIKEAFNKLDELWESNDLVSEIQSQVDSDVKKYGKITSDTKLKAERCGYKIINDKVEVDQDARDKADMATQSNNGNLTESQDLRALRAEADDIQWSVLDDIKKYPEQFPADGYYYQIGAEMACRDFPFMPTYFLLDHECDPGDEPYEAIKQGYLENGGIINEDEVEIYDF